MIQRKAQLAPIITNGLVRRLHALHKCGESFVAKLIVDDNSEQDNPHDYRDEHKERLAHEAPIRKSFA